MKTALITGSSGFIGKHLARNLKSDNYYVIGVDKIMSNENICDKEIVADISKQNQLALEIIEEVDELYHLAGIANVRYCEDHPTEAVNSMVIGSYNILQKCQQYRVSAVIASTGLVYKPIMDRFSNKHVAVEPSNLYTLSKYMSENIASLFRNNGLKVAVARLFNIYGPGQDKAVTYNVAIVPTTIQKIKDDITIQLFSNMYAKRDMLYIDDCVRALRTIMLATILETSTHFIYDVGSGTASFITRIAELLVEASKKDVSIVASNGGDSSMYIADISYLRDIGYHSSLSMGLAEGLKSTYERS